MTIKNFHNPELAEALGHDLKDKTTAELHSEKFRYQNSLSEVLDLARTKEGQTPYNFNRAAELENEDSESGRTATDLRTEAYDCADAITAINMIIHGRNEAQNLEGALDNQLSPAELKLAQAESKLPVTMQSRTSSIMGATKDGRSYDEIMDEFKSNETSLKNTTLNLTAPRFQNVVTVAGDGIVPRRERDTDQPIYKPVPDIQLLDALREIRPLNDGDSYTFPREVSTTANGADRVAENAAYPEQQADFEDVTIQLQKVAAFVAVSDEQLADVSAARTILEFVLRRNVRLKANDLLMNGNGTNNVRGLNAVSNIGAVSKDADTKLFDVYLNGIQTTYNNSFGTPDLIVGKYDELDRLRKERDDRGIYLLGAVDQGAPSAVFGIPFVINQSTPDNSVFMLSSADLGLLTKNQVEVVYGYTGTDFSNGRQSIRATIRINLVVFRTTGITKLSALNTADADA